MKNKSKYFKCSVSNVENGFDVGRVCYISFTEEVTKKEAKEYVFIENIKYDNLHIIVDYALDKKIDTFIKIQVDREKLKERSLSNFTIKKLKKEIKIQEQKMEEYTKEQKYNLLSDSAWYIYEIEEELEKRATKRI